MRVKDSPAGLSMRIIDTILQTLIQLLQTLILLLQTRKFLSLSSPLTPPFNPYLSIAAHT